MPEGGQVQQSTKVEFGLSVDMAESWMVKEFERGVRLMRAHSMASLFRNLQLPDSTRQIEFDPSPGEQNELGFLCLLFVKNHHRDHGVDQLVD